MADEFDSFVAFILGLIGGAIIIGMINNANQNKKYSCPNCGALISYGTNPCPRCRTPLSSLTLEKFGNTSRRDTSSKQRCPTEKQ